MFMFLSKVFGLYMIIYCKIKNHSYCLAVGALPYRTSESLLMPFWANLAQDERTTPWALLKILQCVARRKNSPKLLCKNSFIYFYL